jgi:hypothetical protein
VSHVTLPVQTGVHCPETHERPAPQAAPQAPQFSVSVLVSTHAATPPVVPHGVSGAAHPPPSAVAPDPHWYGVPPPPHVSGAAQDPHWTTLPQPSPMYPQAACAVVHVAGMHAPSASPVGTPHTLGFPPPPQISSPEHVPHCTSPPQPLATGPQLVPSSSHVFGVHEPLVPSGAPSFIVVASWGGVDVRASSWTLRNASMPASPNAPW